MDVHDARLRTLALTLALTLAACGGDAPADAAATASGPVVPQNEYTTAVPVGENAAAAKLEFKLAGLPRPGQPATVGLRVAPKGEAQQITFAYSTDEGLALASTQESQIALGTLTPGAQETRDVLVVPQREGVFLLRVVVTTQTLAQAVGRKSEFAVPLIVQSTGEGG